MLRALQRIRRYGRILPWFPVLYALACTERAQLVDACPCEQVSAGVERCPQPPLGLVGCRRGEAADAPVHPLGALDAQRHRLLAAQIERDGLDGRHRWAELRLARRQLVPFAFDQRRPPLRTVSTSWRSRLTDDE